MGQKTSQPGPQVETVPGEMINPGPASDAATPNSLSGDQASTGQNSSEPASQYVVAPAATIDDVPPSDQSSKEDLPGNVASSQVASLSPDVNANPRPFDGNREPNSSGRGSEKAGQEMGGAATSRSADTGGQEADAGQAEAEGGNKGKAAAKDAKGKGVRGSKDKARKWSERGARETRASKKLSSQEEDNGGPTKRLRARKSGQ